MSNKLLRYTALAAVAVFAMSTAVPALAEGSGVRSSSPPPATTAQTTQPSAPAPGAAAARSAQTVKDLIGRSVYNSRGETVGSITDFVVGNRGAGDPVITDAVVGVGGFLGLGEKQVAIPIEHLRVFGDRIQMSSNVEERLGQLPEFDRSRYRSQRQ